MKNFHALALLAPIVCSNLGCGGPAPGASEVPAEMTVLARLERSPTNVVTFLDSADGIVISETGRAEEADGHASLDSLRAQGMAAAYRALAKDDKVAVPARLLEAESSWQSRAKDQAQLRGLSRFAAPEPLEAAAEPRGARENGGTSDGPIERRQGALGGLSTDAAWWQGLPICQRKNYNTAGATIAWYDAVWCATDQPAATTSWRDTMYYEVSAFGQGNTANIVVNKWGAAGWQPVVNTTVPYRYYQTFSFPPENGAYYYAAVTGTGGQNIGISERYRLAMPGPTFVGNNPSNVEYEFSNDIQGVTHDANNWYLTRTKYGCVSWLCDAFEPKYGIVAKVPLTTSLNIGPSNDHGMPSAWNKFPNGSGRYSHFGDLVHVAGRLYIGMDGYAGAAIGIYDTNLNALTYVPLSQNWTAPCVAFNPQDGFFYVPSDSTTLQKYQISVVGTTATATWKGVLKLSRPVDGWQGAKFSPKGNLWALTNGNYYGIDAANGAVLVWSGINMGSADESEGLDIFDLDTETRPGLYGQLHLQLLNNQVDDDNWWFMHLRAPIGRL